MRILITGVTGQVGWALLSRLPSGAALLSRLPGGAAIIAADRTTLDLARPQALAAALDRLEPELIINPAAYTDVDKAEDEPALAMRVNGEAPGAIARWAAARAVPLVHFSSDYVFDGSGEKPWRETDPPRPLSAYGASKLAGENAIRAAGGAFLIVRTSWVYGAHRANFLRSIVRLARERTELRVVADQIGAPTSAALIAHAVADILAADPENLRRRFAQAEGLVHLAASGATSRHGFACAIVAGLKRRGVRLAVEQVRPISSDEYPARARRPRNSRLDLSRLAEMFGITPSSWEDALAIELDKIARELHMAPDGRI
jgi:dTDP-4-dehydrorhamnose reductase